MALDAIHSQSLKFVRSISIGLIIATHIGQEYKMSFALWTNVGVQIFLMISGFIFGQKAVQSWKSWYLQRCKRLIPSYFIVLIATAIAYQVFLQINIVDGRFLAHFTTLHFILFPGYPFWGGDLWYITAIVLCYLVFPFLYKTRVRTKPYLDLLYLFVAPLFLSLIFYESDLPYRLSADIYSFIFGFAIGRTYGSGIPKGMFSVSLLVAGCGIVMSKLAEIYYWDHAVAAVLIKGGGPWVKFVMAVCIFSFLSFSGFSGLSNNNLVNFFDRYAYEIYLSQSLILGPLSLLYLTQFDSVNVFLAVLVCCLVSVCIQKTKDSILSLPLPFSSR